MNNPILKEDLLSYRFLSQITCSPYENKAVYTVSKQCTKTNGYKKDLYILDLDTLKSAPLTTNGKSKGFIFEDVKTLQIGRAHV